MIPFQSKIFQIAYVVPDIDAAVRHWTESLGVGPFFIVRHAKYREQIYRGEQMSADVSLAFAYAGDLNIELIQQHDDTPSVFRDFRLRHGAGVQHLGVLSDDIDSDTARLSGQGISVLQRGVSADGVETRFFDTELHPGAMLELIRGTAEVRAVFEQMRAAAAAWDHAQPIAFDG